MRLIRRRAAPARYNAWNGTLYFLFSGPTLHPFIAFGQVVGPITIMLLVAVLATLLPAVLAARVSPLRAMQSE